MKTSDIITEAPIRPIGNINPLQFPGWKFYRLTKNPPGPWQPFFLGGDDGRLPISVLRGAVRPTVGINQIRGRPILWLRPFQGTRGEFWLLSDFETWQKSQKLYAMQPADITHSDLELADILKKWAHSGIRSTKGQEIRAGLAQQLLKMEIQPELKQISGDILYRGMSLTSETWQALRQGQVFPMKPQIISSWTQSETKPATFGGTWGIRIAKKFAPSDIIVNVVAVESMFGHLGFRPDDLFSEEEILVRGNGIGPHLDPRRENITFLHEGQPVSD